MNIFFNIAKVTLEEGLMYAVLAMGVYLTYSILDFPDLSVDGTMPLGAIITGVLITHGVPPLLSLLLAFLSGMIMGNITGFLNVKLRIRPLLCGILVYTALLSVNLAILFIFNDGSSIVSFFREETIFTSFLKGIMPDSLGKTYIRTVVVAFVVCIVCKAAIDLFLSTKKGLLLRAAGDNEKYVVMLSQDPGKSKMTGLALGNGFAALAGSVIAQEKGTADQQMGVGMVVLALASVIIGLSVFEKVKWMKPTTKVILGSVLYKAVLSTALALGLPTEYLKLLMAVLFTAALVLSDKNPIKKNGGKNKNAEA